MNERKQILLFFRRGKGVINFQCFYRKDTMAPAQKIIIFTKRPRDGDNPDLEDDHRPDKENSPMEMGECIYG